MATCRIKNLNLSLSQISPIKAAGGWRASLEQVLPKHFYRRDPAEVAESLLGKILVRFIGGKRLSGMIVETEAYYGPEDPASRARKGGGLRRTMLEEPGAALIYGLHKQWLLNVVSHRPGKAGA